MVSGDPAAVSVIVIAAFSAPIAVGAKCPWIVQLAPTGRLVPQVLAKTKEEALAPVTAMLVIVKGVLPVLVRVTDCEGLEAPTVVAGNEILVVESFATDDASPVPLKGMDCGELAALSVMVIAAVNAPVAVGPKCP